MAKEQVQAITKMEEDFAQWYTDIVKKAELVDYSSVKGCMIYVRMVMPYGRICRR
ncbi:Proline--tRNA ligase 2 [Bacillus cereus]|nr:Proline--tRNA ligase 2 [Bacillus cereus]